MMTEQENYDDLLARLDHPPLSWCPTGVPEGLDPQKCIESAEVFGQVDEIDDSRVSDFGPFRMVTLVDPLGERIAIAALGTVLAKRFATVKIGDRVAVRYLGTKPSGTPGQQDYHDYLIAVDRAE